MCNDGKIEKKYLFFKKKEKQYYYIEKKESLISTIIEIFSRQIPPARSTTHSTYPIDLTAQIRSMIMTLHTLSLRAATSSVNPQFRVNCSILAYRTTEKKTSVASIAPFLPIAQ